MDGRLVYIRIYSDPTMEDMREDESRLSERELDKRFSDQIELLKCKAIQRGELMPDMEKTKEAIATVEEAKQIAEEYGWLLSRCFRVPHFFSEIPQTFLILRLGNRMTFEKFVQQFFLIQKELLFLLCGVHLLPLHLLPRFSM